MGWWGAMQGPCRGITPYPVIQTETQETQIRARTGPHRADSLSSALPTASVWEYQCLPWNLLEPWEGATLLSGPMPPYQPFERNINILE